LNLNAVKLKFDPERALKAAGLAWQWLDYRKILSPWAESKGWKLRTSMKFIPHELRDSARFYFCKHSLLKKYCLHMCLTSCTSHVST